MDFVEAVRPHQCTFVPDSAEQATSDHGWRLPADGERLRPVIAAAHALGVRVSLFMDPEPERDGGGARNRRRPRRALHRALRAAHGTARLAEVLATYIAAAEAALRVGLGVNAGHDLNRANLTDFLRPSPACSRCRSATR